MDGLEWGKPAAGWQLSVSLDREKIPWTEPVYATVVLKNVAREPQSIHETSRWSTEVQVEDADGEVERTRFGITVENAAIESRYVPASVPPGESFTWELPLSRMFDLSEGGEFRVRASRVVSGPGEPHQMVTSNIVLFEVGEE